MAIVTGADSGIGRAVAIAFAKEGADIVLSYLPEEELDAPEVSVVIQKVGQKAIRLPGDIGSSDYARSLVSTAIEELGHLDMVVNNAGFQMTHETLDEIPLEEFDHTFRTNVYGTFLLSQAALPKMKPGASIINTTSIQAFEPGEQLVAYAATEAAIANMTKSLAKLAGNQGIRVNAVASGPVWTPLIPSTMPTEKVKSFGENTLFKRPAQPVELARIFVFLASAEASYVSGEIYGATGGRTPLLSIKAFKIERRRDEAMAHINIRVSSFARHLNRRTSVMFADVLEIGNYIRSENAPPQRLACRKSRLSPMNSRLI